MRDDDHGDALAAAGVLQKPQDLPARLVVEGARGLVAQQQARVLGQGARDRDALLLAAGKLRREVCQAPGQAHLGQGLLGVQRVGADLGRELDVLERREVGHQVVELENKAHVGAAVVNQIVFRGAADVATARHHGARRGVVHAAQDVERRGLARAGLAQDNGQLALLDAKRGAVEGVDLGGALAVAADDVCELDVRHAGPFLVAGAFARRAARSNRAQLLGPARLVSL